MKLGIINGWSEGCFEYVRNKGLEAVEFCVNVNYDSAEFLSKAEEIKGYSEKYNVVVGSTGRWGGERINEDGSINRELMQDDMNIVSAASIFGCPVFNCGVNYIEDKSFYDNCQYAIAYLKELVEFGKEKGVKIAVYNCRWDNFICEPKAWSVILSAIPELGIKYDVSHCLGDNGNYLAELRDWGNRIYHFHLKGSVYIDGEHYDDAPAGMDITDWNSVMDILYTHDYNAMLSIEPHSNFWQGKKGQWAIDYTINHFRPYVMPDDYEYSENPFMP